MAEKFAPYNKRTLDLYDIRMARLNPEIAGEGLLDLSVLLSRAIQMVDPELKNPYVPEVAGKDFVPNSKPSL